MQVLMKQKILRVKLRDPRDTLKRTTYLIRGLSTSTFGDVKKLKKLKFTLKNNYKFAINLYNDIVHVTCSDDPSYLGTMLEKLHYLRKKKKDTAASPLR